MLKRVFFGLVGLFVLALVPLGAYAQPANISQKVADCDPKFPNNCVKPNADGSINVTGSFSLSNYALESGGNLAAAKTDLDALVAAAANPAGILGTNGTGIASSSNAFDVGLRTVGGTAVDTNSGNKSGGTLRVVLATDQPALTNSQPVTPTSSSATGSAVPASGSYIATSQSAVLKGVIGCDTHAFYDASDNGKKTVVTGVSSKKIYICGYTLATGSTATNLSLTSGTGTDCATTSTAITPAYQLVANDRVGANASFWNGLITLANADNLCVNASAGNAHQVEIWYTIQ
jgi:hypothetical protein